MRSILENLEKSGVKRVYLDGGVTSRLGLSEGVVTDLTISVIPILLGSGIPLFGEIGKEISLRHVNTKSFSSGLVQTSYEVRK